MKGPIRHALEATAAVGLMAGALAGCGGEPMVEVEGQIQRYGAGVDVQVVEDQWVPHRDQEEWPFGEVRNVYPHDEFSHCEEVANTGFGWNEDDFDCQFDFSWDACESTDTTRCIARYETLFDYERLEEVEIEDCPAPIRMREFYTDDTDVDQDCLDRVQPHQRANQTSRYIIRVSVSNPKKSEEGQPPFLHKDLAITADEWNRLGDNRNVTIQVKGDQIIDAKI